MPHVVPLDPKQAAGETADIFREIASAFGMVPNLFRTSAHHTPLLRADWNTVKAVMSAALRATGMSPEAIAGIMEDPDKGDFPEKEKGLIRLARQANQAPRRVAGRPRWSVAAGSRRESCGTQSWWSRCCSWAVTPGGGPGGKVRLCYNLPEYLKKRHGIEGKDEALDGLARTLGAIADRALE